MHVNENTAVVTPCLGDAVAQEVLQWIGAFRQLSKATIISFNMQDYDFWGNGRLSIHLLRQLSFGAQVTVMTTPPPGKTGRGATFKRKLTLLEELDRNGADIYLHTKLHAKAYLFQDSNQSEMLIVGSANLTASGFGTKGSGHNDLLELALLTGDHVVYESTEALIETSLIGDPHTLDFATWVANNALKIAEAKGAP